MIQVKVSLYIRTFILTLFARPQACLKLVVPRTTQRTNAVYYNSSYCISFSCQHRRSLPKLVSRTKFPIRYSMPRFCMQDQRHCESVILKLCTAQIYKLVRHWSLLSECTKTYNKCTVTEQEGCCDALSCFPDLDAKISTKTPCGQHGLRGVCRNCECHSMVSNSFLFRCCFP